MWFLGSGLKALPHLYCRSLWYVILLKLCWVWQLCYEINSFISVVSPARVVCRGCDECWGMRMRLEDTFLCSVQSAFFFFYDHFFPKTHRRNKIQFFYSCLDLKQAGMFPRCLHKDPVFPWLKNLLKFSNCGFADSFIYRNNLCFYFFLSREITWMDFILVTCHSSLFRVIQEYFTPDKLVEYYYLCRISPASISSF